MNILSASRLKATHSSLALSRNASKIRKYAAIGVTAVVGAGIVAAGIVPVVAGVVAGSMAAEAATVTAYGLTTIGALGIGAASGRATEKGLRDTLSSFVLQTAPERQKNNRAFVRGVTTINPNAIRHASEHLKGNRIFMQEIVKTNPHAVKYASKALRGDADFMTVAAKQDPSTLQYATAALKKNHAFMKKMAKINLSALKYADATLLDTPQFIKDMILEEITCLKTTIRDLKNTTKKPGELGYNEKEKQDLQKEISRKEEELQKARKTGKETAVKILEKAGASVLKDVHTMTAIAEEFPKEAFQKADVTLHKTPQFMLPIILDNINVLKKATPEVLKDTTTMIAIAQKHPKEAYEAADDTAANATAANATAAAATAAAATAGAATAGAATAANATAAGNTLKQNPEFMLPIAKDDLETLGDAEDTLLGNNEFMKELILHKIEALDYAHDSVLSHEPTMRAIAEELAKRIIDSSDSAAAKKHLNMLYEKASPTLRKSAGFMLPVVKNNIDLLKESTFDKGLLKNIDFMCAVVLHNVEALKNADRKLLNNVDKMQAIAAKYPKEAMDRAANSTWLKGNRTFAMSAITADPEQFSNLPEELKTDYLFITQGLQNNPALFNVLPEELRKDKERILQLLRDSKKASFFEHLDPSLLRDREFMKKAARIDGATFQYAAADLRQDAKYVMSIFIGSFLSLEKRVQMVRQNAKALFPHIDPKLKTDKDFFSKIRSLPGILGAVVKDNHCAKMIRKPNFFTPEEINLLIDNLSDPIKELKLESGAEDNRALATVLISAKPALIKSIKTSDEELLDLAMEIATHNSSIMEKLNDSGTSEEAKQRKRVYGTLIEDDDFLSRIAKTQPDILEFVPSTESIRDNTDLMLSLIQPALEADHKKIRLLKHLGANDKKNPVLFSQFAASYGDKVYDYADDTIRKKRRWRILPGAKYGPKTS